jgi:macrolide transport system ATP-binding/permease protein
MMGEILTRLNFLIFPKKPGELDQEVGFHLEQLIEAKTAKGLDPIEARRQALIEFGGLERTREQCDRERPGHWIGTCMQDLRHGLRMLRKGPGFTFVAVLTLAAGIGANAIVFSLLNSLVFRPLNVPDGRNFYEIQRGKNAPSLSYPDYLDLRDGSRSFDGLIVYAMAPAGLNTGAGPQPIWLYEASGNYFDVLRIKPYLGRFFHSADEHGPNSAPYIVLSYRYWQSHFQADRAVVGRTVQLNKFDYTIIGVAPPEFRSTELFFAPDLWTPIVNQPQVEGLDELQSRGARGIWVVGHLRAQVSAAQAAEELRNLAAVLARRYPKEDDGLSFSLARPGLLGDMIGQPVRAFVAGLSLLSGLILLAACANLGSMFAARTADRAREIALRLALGSSRARILRQLLTEAMLIAIIGGTVGVAGGLVLLRGLSAWRPLPDMPIGIIVTPDARTYVVALALALFSAVLFGLVPLHQVAKADPYQGIKGGVGGWGISRRLTARDLLLAFQITICAVLVTASLVAVRGMIRSLNSNFGFVPQHALQLNTDLAMAGYGSDQVPVVERRILDAVSAVPGVTAAAYSDRIPLNIGWSSATVFADSATDYRLSNAALDAMHYAVSPGYFKAARTSVLLGRTFDWNDGKDAPKVAVINREFARKLFGSEKKAIGGFFKVWGGERIRVIGVVEDGKYRTLSEDPQAAMFVPALQHPSSWTWLVVRSNRAPGELVPALEQTLRSLNTGLPFTINAWEREMGTALFAARAASLALGVLGGLGAMLAITGIFGMAAYSVSRRLRELGIRIALGAQRRQLLGAALSRVSKLLAVGSMTGLVLGLAATRLLSYIVYQASPRDPSVLVGAAAAMLGIGVVAAWLPARRALAADPLVLLREE